jgi:outer membrane protein OmpA-like peptidoglycan-associated protein
LKIAKFALVLAMTVGASAQAQNNVINRTTPAVNYGHRHSNTPIDFRGTDLMPAANGEADVRSNRGVMEVKAEFGELQNPSTFGNEYLTYVLWAISPEGQSVNLGEVLVGDNHRSKLDVTTNLQAFAMIVTAEPYYAVRRPSNVVVLENAITRETNGTTEAVVAKYELIGRGGYIPSGYTFDPVVLNARLPLEFFEARNAVRIAHSEGAEQFASDSYASAVRQMKEADAIATRRHLDRKALISVSREVVQTAEDATEISMKRMEADRTSAEKRGAEGRERDAKAQSQQDMQARQNAEAQTADAVRQRGQAENAAADANAQRAQAENAAADANRGRANAERATVDAQQQQQAAQADSDRNRAAAASSDQQLQQALRDRETLRASLLLQFNAILATRDTARGLVVNMSDVLFDTGKYTLRPLAREKLAKISGIVLAYPSLLLAIEGDTDSVGGDSYNQTLSEQRANAVRDYLAKQNIPMASMTAQGFGKTQPVASNDTAEGRQQNRRVELVVSGDVIGTVIGVVSKNR